MPARGVDVLGGWIDRRVRTVVLAIGDVGCLVLVVAIGLLEHGLNPLSRPGYLLFTSVPFVLAWLLIAPLLGVYARPWWDRTLLGLVVVVVAWVAAAWIGAHIRATDVFPGGAHPVFVLVMVGAGLVALLPWRLSAILVNRRWPG